MNFLYVGGVLSAVLAGVCNFSGQILQKKSVNRIPKHLNKSERAKYLLKNKLWLIGLFIYIGMSTVFYMIAEYLTGPVLVPGIMTSGLLILPFAASKILGEKNGLKEISGIFLLVSGTVLIALSRIVILPDEVDLSDKDLLFRIFYLTAGTVLSWIAFDVFARFNKRKRGVLKGFAAGFPYVLSNFWIFPLYGSMIPVFNGQFSSVYIIFFVLSAVILIITNILGISELQAAFRYEDVSIVAPVQQIPIQIAPLFYYFFVFGNRIAGLSSNIYIISGVILILISGFLLSKVNIKV